MTIVEHIQELRSRLIKAMAGLLLGTILGFWWYQASFTIPAWRVPFFGTDVPAFHVMSLGEILKGPYCALDPSQRFGEGDECRLLATSPFEMFMLRLKVGAIAGLAISSPLWLYQLWAFITPGLVRKERRNTLIVVFIAAFLFVIGAVLAYIVVAYGLEFLLQVGDNAQIAALTGGQYFNFILALIVIFGVSFELPLFIVMLNVVGVLPYETMKDKRRIIIVLIFIFAAFMSPGQDPISMMALAISLSLLVELALQFCRFNDKRRSNERPEWLDLDDDQGSGPISAPGGIGEQGGIDAPAPVSAPTSVQASAPVTASSRPTRNSRPPRPQPVAPTPTEDLRSRPLSDFDDVL